MGRWVRVCAALVASALVLVACGGPQPVASEPQAGPDSASTPRVPSLEVASFAGPAVSLDDYAGRPLVVNFWASWCPPCVAEMPDFEAVHQAIGDQVAFVGVNTQDTPDAATGMVEQTGVTYDLVRDPDGALSRAFEVIGMPSTFFVDEAGVIIDRHTGLLTAEALEAQLAESLGIEVGG